MREILFYFILKRVLRRSKVDFVDLRLEFRRAFTTLQKNQTSCENEFPSSTENRRPERMS